MKFRVWGVVVVAALLAGCGKEERREAVGLYKVLVEKRAGFAESSSMEKEMVSGAKSWCAGVVANGSGSGKDLDQNASVARDLAKSADTISAKVGELRQAVYNLAIQKEFTQDVRTTLIGALTKRQRSLQELKMGLEDAAKGFEALAQTRGYKGDSYPNAMTKLTTTVQGFRSQGDALTEAMTALSGKYAIQESEVSALRPAGT